MGWFRFLNEIQAIGPRCSPTQLQSGWSFPTILRV